MPDSVFVLGTPQCRWQLVWILLSQGKPDVCSDGPIEQNLGKGSEQSAEPQQAVLIRTLAKRPYLWGVNWDSSQKFRKPLTEMGGIRLFEDPSSSPYPVPNSLKTKTFCGVFFGEGG
jgi:hypothetical protein